MYWSRFNFLYESDKYGFLLYNTRTNALLSLTEKLYLSLREISQGGAFNKLSNEVVNSLKKAKVIVGLLDDDNFVVQKKYTKYNRDFSKEALGIVIVPTYACNFKCPYCYETNLPQSVMNDVVEARLIDFIKSSRGKENLHICWHGGEPLLAFDRISSFLSRLERESSIVLQNHSMVTNGYLLDDEKCLVLKKHKLKSIQITIDGLPISHNKSRIHKSGNPTFDVIIKNILRVFSIIPDCHVIIRVNIHKDNKDDYPALYKYLTELFGGNNYSIDMSYANDHGNGCKVACFTEKEKLLYIADLMRQHGFNKIDIYPCLQLGGCVATCANSFVVGPLGELYKCWVDVGVADKKVGSIFENKMNLSLISEYAVGTDMFSDENCLQCSLLPICDGGCNLRRFEAKQKNEEFSLCPIDKDKIPLLLDLYYEQKFSRK